MHAFKWKFAVVRSENKNKIIKHLLDQKKITIVSLKIIRD